VVEYGRGGVVLILALSFCSTRSGYSSGIELPDIRAGTRLAGYSFSRCCIVIVVVAIVTVASVFVVVGEC